VRPYFPRPNPEFHAPHSHSIASGHHNDLILLWKIFFEAKNTVAEFGKKLRF
jgi:hypothetical protein